MKRGTWNNVNIEKNIYILLSRQSQSEQLCSIGAIEAYKHITQYHK